MTASASINRPVAGALWMLASGLFFVGVNGIVKALGTALPAAEAAFLRYALGLVFLIPMLRPLLRARLTPKVVGIFALRGMMHAVAVILWFFAMARIPIAEVTAINYLAPVGVTIGAALFLGERLAVRRIAAVGVALIGVVIVLRPGLRTVEPGHIAMLGAAVLFAGSYLVAKRLTLVAGAPVIVAMLSIWVTIGLAPFAALAWTAPTLSQVLWLLLTAGFATAGHLCMTQAFRMAPVTVTQPVTFLQLLWATLLGVLFFHEPLDLWVVTGGLLIIAAIAFITWREAVLNRRGVTPPVTATEV
ncbi:MAG: EamA family transporter [Rhodobacteraceae bacterium]|nr:EamA family transporter [Paracoccaceae bacterium]